MDEMDRLRTLQLEYNKRRMKMMEIVEAQGDSMHQGIEFVVKTGKPITKRWKISERDVKSWGERFEGLKRFASPEEIKKRRIEKELEDVYRDAYLSWGSYYSDNRVDGMDFKRFGTAPVRNAYWQWDGKVQYVCKEPLKLLTHPIPESIRDLFASNTPSTCAHTMVFRRYPNLMTESERLDVLIKALLGFPEVLGCKFAQAKAIVNDSWVVDLRGQPEDNYMMEAFLKGCGENYSDLKKQWDKSQGEGTMMAVDVSAELADLLKVYTDALQHLENKEKQSFDSLIGYMERFIDAHKETKKVANKLANLKSKLSLKQKGCEDCDEDEEGDDE